jgi:hypothetical protein
VKYDSEAKESEFDALRASGSIRPRVERSEPLPPIYPTCEHCGSEAPSAEVYDETSYPQLIARGCLQCASDLVKRYP